MNTRRRSQKGIVPGIVIQKSIRRQEGFWKEIVEFAEENYGERGRVMVRMLQVKKGNSSKKILIEFLESEGFDVARVLEWANGRFITRDLKAAVQTLYDWLGEDVCLNLLRRGSCQDIERCPFTHPSALRAPP